MTKVGQPDMWTQPPRTQKSVPARASRCDCVLEMDDTIIDKQTVVDNLGIRKLQSAKRKWPTAYDSQNDMRVIRLIDAD